MERVTEACQSINCLFLSWNVFETDLPFVQNGSLVVEFHVEMLRPCVKLRIAGESNGRLIVSHDVGHR
jgi:hypothetical protein